MDGDRTDLLGDELYRADPRWRVCRKWRYTRGHPSIHATAQVGVIPTRGTWFAAVAGTATEWSTEAGAVEAARWMMADHDMRIGNGRRRTTTMATRRGGRSNPPP